VDKKFKPIMLGLIFGLLTLLSAEFMASSFGIYEDNIKGALIEEALEHTEGVTIPGHENEEDLDRKVFSDEAEARKTADKAWVYLKRAHAHGEGLGAIAIVLCLLIGLSYLKKPLKFVLSSCIGVGAFIYPLCWLYAGSYMVDKGKTAAKADIHFFAMGSVGLYLSALVLLFLFIVLYTVVPNSWLGRYFFSRD
jgi:hypothetical protein